MKKLAILGSTGSIGQSTQKLLAAHVGLGQVHLLSAHGKIGLLLEQIVALRPKVAVLTGAKPSKEQTAAALAVGCKLCAGTEALLDELNSKEIDTVLLAVSGSAGLEYGLKALSLGKRLAIANKEPLVVAGKLFLKTALAGGGEILPVDSEHSAIFQCLEGQSADRVERILLTSSGGPFHTWSEQALLGATPEQALRHPTWNMGAKITIDSATMMNKALEVLEARWLFSQPVSSIEVCVHRQSIVHSMVEFCDGSVMAQLGVTDMQFPILYALTYPERYPSRLARLDFSSGLNLSFEKVNPVLREAIDIAMDCAEDAPACVAMNAANECFVQTFLKGECAFLDVYALLRDMIELSRKGSWKADSLEEILSLDCEIRAHSFQWLNEKAGRSVR